MIDCNPVTSVSLLPTITLVDTVLAVLDVMIVLGNDLDCNRIGFSISKKVGNSVVRHYFARILREIYRLHKEVFSSGLDIVIIVKPSASECRFREIESAFLHLAKLHNKNMQ